MPGAVGDVLPDGTHRDGLDRRVLADLAGCQGDVIDSPTQVDGWPAIPAAAAPADRDRDHFPDAWEASQPGMDPTRADNPWKTLGGIPAIEAWLATLAGDR